MTRLRMGVMVLALAFPLAARAQTATDEAMENAKVHFEKGYDFFAKKQYREAAGEFQTAYNYKAYPDFLYNQGLANEKLGNKAEAITLYEKYLRENPKARDADKIKDRLDRLRGIDKGKPPPPVEDKVRGVITIESIPAGANVYIGGKGSTPIGTTPWTGSWDGTETVVVEAKGYNPFTDKIQIPQGKVYLLKVPLQQASNLAWIEIRANIPAASVFIDDRASGEVGRTPYMGNIVKGKHKIWISKDGFEEQYREIELEGGKAYNLTDFVLPKGKIGFFYLTGSNIEGGQVKVDGKVVCEKAPCRFQAPSGKRTIEVERDGFKTFTREQEVLPATETTLNVKMAESPSRLDVLWNFGFAAAFIAGGVVLGLQSSSTYDEIQADIDAGNPPVFPDDSRFLKGKLFAIAADACFAIGVITAATGVVSLLLEKGPPSSGTGETRDLGASIIPVFGPGYAGVSAGVRW